RVFHVTGVQTCALPIFRHRDGPASRLRGVSLRAAGVREARYPKRARKNGKDRSLPFFMTRRPRPPARCCLDDAHRFDQSHHAPGLRARDGTAFRDFDGVAFVVLVRLVVTYVLRRTNVDLAIDGVLDAAFDQNDHGLVHLVADDLADQRALALGLSVLGFAHDHFPAFSVSKVRTRAMSRRTLRSWLVLASCCVAFCMRRPNCAFSRLSSSLPSSAASFERSSLAFIVYSLSTDMTRNERGRDRQLGGGQAERLARQLFADPFHFVEHLAGL